MSRRSKGTATRIRTGRNAGKWMTSLTVGRDDTGRRARRYFYGATKDDVLNARAEAARDKEDGLKLPTQRLTVGAWLSEWIKSKSTELAPRTLRSYSDNIRLYITPTIGHIPLKKLRRSDVRGLLHIKPEKKTLSATTRDYLRAILRSSLNDAIREDLLRRNVAALVKSPEGAGGSTKNPLSPAEVSILFRAILGHRWRAMFVVAVTMGLRQGEVLGLRWSSENRETGTLLVDKQLQRYDGAWHLTDPKSEAGVRELPMPRLAREALAARRTEQKTQRLIAGKDWKPREGFETLVFTTLTGKPVHARHVIREWHKLIERNKLPAHRFHDLRDSAASFAHYAGASMKDIQEMLGHADERTTSDAYVKVFAEAKRELADRMDGAFDDAITRKR